MPEEWNKKTGVKSVKESPVQKTEPPNVKSIRSWEILLTLFVKSNRSSRNHQCSSERSNAHRNTVIAHHKKQTLTGTIPLLTVKIYCSF